MLISCLLKERLRGVETEYVARIKELTTTSQDKDALQAKLQVSCNSSDFRVTNVMLEVVEFTKSNH